MADLSSLGARTSAIWTRAQALTVLSSAAVDRKLRTEWQSPYPGVHADAGYALDAVQWANAGVLASGGGGQPVPVGRPDDQGRLSIKLGAAACGRDAARVWGFPLVDDEDPATGGSERFVHDVHTWSRMNDLLAPVVKGDVRAHVLHRHTLTFQEGDLVQHDSGLWLTAPLRTAMDCCLLLPFEPAVCVMDDGLHRGLFTIDDVAAALARRAGQPGVERQRSVAAAADGRAEAPSETLLRLVLKPGWPELEPQVRVYDERGHPVRRYDLGDRTIKLGVESDGKRGHAGDRMAAKDHTKDRTAERYGWKSERATWFEIRRQQAKLRARVLATAERLRARAA
ncbi:MAG: hypothetical protein ABR549_16545 [Mycobacteriales bacterium]